MRTDWLTLAGTQLWQVTILAAVVLLVVHWLGRTRPHLGYALCLLVLLKCVVPPIASSSVGAFCWLQPRRPAETSTSQPGHAAVGALTAGEAGPPTGEPASASTAVSEPASQASPVRMNVAVAILIIWLGGVVGLLGILGVRWLSLRRLLSTRVVADFDEQERQLRELCRRMDLRPVELWVVAGRTTPFVMGILRPRVVVPATLIESLPPAAVEPILAHELVHVRRRDVLVGRLQLLVQIAWWFHPLVWWIQARARQLRERCCDEAVVGDLGIPTSHYAHSLVEVAALGTRVETPVGVPGMSAFDFTAGRIEDLLRRRGTKTRRLDRWDVAVAVVLAIVLLPGASLSTASPVDDGLEPDRVIVTPPEPERFTNSYTLIPVDGFARDADHDGIFELVDATGDDLRVSRDDSRILPHEVALLEFDASVVPRDERIESIQFEGETWMIQTDNAEPLLDLRVELYDGDGRLDVGDATSPGIAVAALALDMETHPGPLVFSIDADDVGRPLERFGHLGMRLSLREGSRVFLSSRDVQYRDGKPVLHVTTTRLANDPN